MRPPAHPPGSSAERPKQTYTRRDMLVGASALAVLVGVICGVSWGGPHAIKPAAKTVPAPVPLALRASPTSAQQEFVDRAVARYSFADPERVRVLKIGNDVCGLLSTGSSVDDIAATVTGTSSGLSPADATSLVNLAAQDLCPGLVPLPAPTAP